MRTAARRSGRTAVKILTIADLSPGDVVASTCKNKARGCAEAASGSTVATGSTLSSTTVVKGLSLDPGAKLVVELARANAVPRTVVHTMRAAKKPQLEVT